MRLLGQKINSEIPPNSKMAPPVQQSFANPTADGSSSNGEKSKGNPSWKRTSRTGLLKSEPPTKEQKPPSDKSSKTSSQNQPHHSSSSVDAAAAAPDIVSWLPLLKKTSAMASNESSGEAIGQSAGVTPIGLFCSESDNSTTNFASPKLAAKHNQALKMAAVSTRHHHQLAPSGVQKITEQKK